MGYLADRGYVISISVQSRGCVLKGGGGASDNSRKSRVFQKLKQRSVYLASSILP